MEVSQSASTGHTRKNTQTDRQAKNTVFPVAHKIGGKSITTSTMAYRHVSIVYTTKTINLHIQKPTTANCKLNQTTALQI